MSQQVDHASGLPRLALFTHYPGDVRTVTMQIYDTYLLKALDVKLPYADSEEPVYLRCLGNMVCIWVSKSSRCGGAGTTQRILPDLEVSADEPRRCAVELSAFDPEHAVAAPLMRILNDLVARGVATEGRDFAWGPPTDFRRSSATAAFVADIGHSSVEDYLQARAASGGSDSSLFELRGRRLELDSGFLTSLEGQPLLDTIARLRPKLAQDPLRHPFNAAIRCLGWRMDTSLLAPELRKKVMEAPPRTSISALTSSGSTAPAWKYPQVGVSYESPAVAGMYFAGALAHARDFRRSAGGFIHGFRYTARALHRALRREEGLGWPNRTFELNSLQGQQKLMRHIWLRTNEAAGPYQMFGELADVAVFKREGPSKDLVAEYLEEVPISYAHDDPQLAAAPRLFLKFVYGRRFGPGDLPSPGAVGAEFAELSAFLHPRFELFGGSSLAGRAAAAGLRQPALLTHAMVEDVFTEWQAHVGHVDPLLRFLSAVLDRVATLLPESSTSDEKATGEVNVTAAALAASVAAAWLADSGASGAPALTV
eukprot:TRINITY_DN21354_c0_g1_i1.p1 TRINITY_DN21354_c0_g1~~TRINITY_DN21354_c0_g1_i1.p1  ORF type:complete len:539 (+),score=90.37 TRINITY_DN21354_c0_g1_i1:112-1728(+)